MSDFKIAQEEVLLSKVVPDSNDPNKIYELVSKKDWFIGKGNNMIETKKDIYFKIVKVKLES